MTAPDRLWCWNFQSTENAWESGWGGYARPHNRHAMDEREAKTGAEYIRADLCVPDPLLTKMEEN